MDWKHATSYVQDRGLSGRFSPQKPELRIETEGCKTEGVCKELEAFAMARWPDATDVMWLVNPVKLQSVPALVSTAPRMARLTEKGSDADILLLDCRHMLTSSYAQASCQTQLLDVPIDGGLVLDTHFNYPEQ